jgi:predicted nucleic acid-binding Zn ribbon protein
MAIYNPLEIKKPKVYKYKCSKCGFITKENFRSDIFHVFNEGVARGTICVECGGEVYGHL